MSQSTVRREDDLDRTYEELESEHRDLEHRLKMLNRPRSVSPEEQAEIQRIKKRKLAIKDQLQSFQR